MDLKKDIPESAVIAEVNEAYMQLKARGCI